MIKIFSWITFFLLLLRAPAFANVGEVFGFGSRNAALGGAVVAGPGDSFSAYHNPASLGAGSDANRLKISWGLLFMQPRFEPIQNVVTQNSFNSDQPAGTPLYGDVSTSDYRATFGQVFGLSYALFPDFYNFSIGIVSFLPVNQFAFMDSGESYIPEYLLYRARTQRPQVELGVGADLGKGFSVGFGFHTAFSLSSAADAFMSNRTGTPSQIRFISELKPKAAPYLGFLYTAQNENKSWAIGAVLRFPVASDNSMRFHSGSKLGPLPTIPINFSSTSALFYDPLSLELGGSWQVWSTSRIYFQVDYQVWNRFQSPELLIVPDADAVNLSPGVVPGYPYANIVLPRVGQEIEVFADGVLRYGYAYRPSIFTGAPTGVGNYLDPAKHMLNLGLGLKSLHWLGPKIPCSLDFHLSYQYLVPFNVVKTSGGETGEASDLKIGAPGYKAGGSLFGGGVSFQLEI